MRYAVVARAQSVQSRLSELHRRIWEQQNANVRLATPNRATNADRPACIVQDQETSGQTMGSIDSEAHAEAGSIVNDTMANKLTRNVDNFSRAQTRPAANATPEVCGSGRARIVVDEIKDFVRPQRRG